MATSSFSGPHFQAHFRPDLGLGIARWLLAAGDAQLQQDYEQLLDIAQTYGCARWLLDVRRLPAPSQELGSWVRDSYYPKLQLELGRIVRLARLRTPGIEMPEKEPRTRIYQGIEEYTCYSEAEAIRWLGV
jgi:hypothetical protein